MRDTACAWYARHSLGEIGRPGGTLPAQPQPPRPKTWRRQELRPRACESPTWNISAWESPVRTATYLARRISEDALPCDSPGHAPVAIRLDADEMRLQRLQALRERPDRQPGTDPALPGSENLGVSRPAPGGDRFRAERRLHEPVGGNAHLRAFTFDRHDGQDADEEHDEHARPEDDSPQPVRLWQPSSFDPGRCVAPAAPRDRS